MLKKAVHRLETVERWVDGGQEVEEYLLSLQWHWEQVRGEEQAKAARARAERKEEKEKRRVAASQTEIPASFESLP